jgi:hypothetical protein
MEMEYYTMQWYVFRTCRYENLASVWSNLTRFATSTAIYLPYAAYIWPELGVPMAAGLRCCAGRVGRVPGLPEERSKKQAEPGCQQQSSGTPRLRCAAAAATAAPGRCGRTTAAAVATLVVAVVVLELCHRRYRLGRPRRRSQRRRRRHKQRYPSWPSKRGLLGIFKCSPPSLSLLPR